MSAIVEKEFDRHLKPRERHRGFPKISLRQRSADHPMIMFFMVVVTTFTAMAIVPSSGPAFTSFGASAAVSPSGNVRPTDVDLACRGQAWGAESVQCLAVIAKDSGRTVRVIAG